MEETLRINLIELASRFAQATNVSPATISKRALNDNTFFDRLEKGKGFTVRTFDKVLDWMFENWPENTEWPSNIPQPDRPKSAPFAVSSHHVRAS